MTAPAQFDDDLLQVHLAEAARRLPGPDYYAVLAWIHQIVQPKSYVEIGVRQGDSLRCALPETSCVGIDPEPGSAAFGPRKRLIFPVSSDAFFASQDLAEILGEEHFDLAFIDGLHLFEQSLRDFINLERFAGRRSIILIHDCLPLDAETSSRIRTTHFYSGDIWKLCLCLNRERPDLDIRMVMAGPTGLCVVRNLDQASTVLASAYQSLVEKYVPLTFDDYFSRRGELPQAVANTFESVALWLNSEPTPRQP